MREQRRGRKIAMAANELDAFLREERTCRVATVGADGRPHNTPLWFVWDGSAIHIYSLTHGAKQKHIAANDKVALHFDSGPGGGDIVVISGRAEIVPDAPPPSRFPGLLDKYAPAIEYMGREPKWYDDEYAVALRVTPERAWTIP